MDMYFLGVSSSRNEEEKKKCEKTKKKNAGTDLGYCPKQCHDTMENCIVTWPLGVQVVQVGWERECVTIQLLYRDS